MLWKPTAAPRNSVPEMMMRTDSARPSVANARYAPSSRSEGMPTSTPAHAVTNIASGSAPQNGMPNTVEITADEYAPIAASATCPTVT